MSPASRCVLGAAFKPGSDDVRDSRLDVARILHGLGAQVTVYDPAALASARRASRRADAGTVADAARDAHVVLLLTEWPEFRALRPDSLGQAVARRNIVDGRNVLDPDEWRDAGWNYRALGAPTAAVSGALLAAGNGRGAGGSELRTGAAPEAHRRRRPGP